jgi:hypothetical protein
VAAWINAGDVRVSVSELKGEWQWICTFVEYVSKQVSTGLREEAVNDLWKD